MASFKRKYCPQCDVRLSTTDLEAGYCTQCGQVLCYTLKTVTGLLLRILQDVRRHERKMRTSKPTKRRRRRRKIP